jgi:hypothetical protein
VNALADHRVGQWEHVLIVNPPSRGGMLAEQLVNLARPGSS